MRVRQFTSANVIAPAITLTAAAAMLSVLLTVSAIVLIQKDEITSALSAASPAPDQGFILMAGLSGVGVVVFPAGALMSLAIAFILYGHCRQDARQSPIAACGGLLCVLMAVYNVIVVAVVLTSG